MLTKRIHLFCALCLLFTLNISTAFAVEINDKGAKKVKSTLSQHLENYKKAIKDTGGTLITKGDISVEQGDTYYAATLPEIIYTTATNENINIGLIAINVIPVEKTDDWKMSVAIPTPITVTNKEDKVIQRIDIGQQNMGGLWSDALDNFSKISTKYENIKFTDIQKGNFFTIDQMILKTNLEEKEEDSWSGPTNILFSNLNAGSTTQENLFSLEKIEISGKVESYSPKAQKKALEKLESSDKKEVTGNFSSILFDLVKSAGDMTLVFNLKNLKINEQVNPQNNLKGIETIQFGYKSTTTQGDNISQDFDISYNGLSFKTPEKTFPLIPQEFKTSISLENFPFMEIVNFAEKTVGKDKSGSARQVAATKAMNFLPQKLTEAGTIFSLKETKFKNSFYDAKINGEIKASSTSQIGGIGNLNIETTDLDKLMTALEKHKNGKSFAQQLSLFRMISDQKGNKNIAKIKLNEQGQISINGKDMSALMGGPQTQEETPQSK